MEGNLPVISLIALLIAIVLSVTTSLNIGTLAMGLALVVGNYIGGAKISDIIKGYPTSLFILLAGVTYLFAIAQVNGTLEKITRYAIKATGGNVALLPIAFFFLALGISAMGPGQITTAALMAAPAMLLAEEVGMSPLLMALVVGNGAQAGAMSPIAPPGLITSDLVAKMGVTGASGVLWLNMFIVHFAVAIIAYVLFGGLKLLRVKDHKQRKTLMAIKIQRFDRAQIFTLVGIAMLIIGSLSIKKFDIGLNAFLIGAVLSLLKAADEGKAIKAMPWATILMVTGVTVLVQLMSTVGGTDLFASLMAKISTPFTITLVAGFLAGLISVYGSTTGVILPTFIPLAPVLLEKVGGSPADLTQLMPLLSSIIVCGFIVDLSPLSTTGAVFLANAGPKADKTRLFRDMLIWGLSMSVVGALISWLAFTVLKLP
jgi:di/tricarboxylate transporter